MDKLPTVEQKENLKTKLYHVSSFKDLENATVGDTFTLAPGPQGAEGKGVYFSQDKPRPSAAEGTAKSGITGVVVIETDSKQGWWRSKLHFVKKFNRPRTWHSDKKNIILTVKEVRKEEGLTYPFIVCNWEFEK